MINRNRDDCPFQARQLRGSSGHHPGSGLGHGPKDHQNDVAGDQENVIGSGHTAVYEHYLTIKAVHQASAGLSLALFFLRGIWMLGWPGLLRARWVRIVPHVIDTALLTSAVLLAWMAQQYPFVHGWITAKVVALLIYIGLGTIALKRGPTRTVRLAAWLAAIAVFLYIGAVAFSKQVIPF
ncbi:MAG: SirB2 family protein [Ectothiorhodospiraceae bacterium]|nr:SirB2 family protein [Ectothiorhodospiraceae bacterium]